MPIIPSSPGALAPPLTSKCARRTALRCSCTAFAVESPMVHMWEELELPSLVEHGTVYIEQSRIKSHEVGPNQQSSMITISNILQECASNHIVTIRGRSKQYFAADPELAKRDLIFVLTRMQIRMQEYPRWGDIVKVRTYFQSEGRVGARRDWVLSNALTGEAFGRATSSWVLVNYKTRRLARMPEPMKAGYAGLMPDPPLHCIDESETRLKLPELPDSNDRCRVSSTHRASPVHMDMNNHVNNTAYLTWLLECMPEEVQEDGILEEYEVDYKAEGVAGALMQWPCSVLLLYQKSFALV